MRNCDFRAAAAERADNHAGDEARVETEDDVAAAATHQSRVDLMAVAVVSVKITYVWRNVFK